jgi:hypothetical protein
MKAEVLTREFADRTVYPSDGRLLLQPADAIALVDRAAEEGVPIVRVAGAPAADSAAELGVVREADFSPRVREGHGCWQDADAFIRERSGLGLVFELALGDDPLELV